MDPTDVKILIDTKIQKLRTQIDNELLGKLSKGEFRNANKITVTGVSTLGNITNPLGIVVSRETSRQTITGDTTTLDVNTHYLSTNVTVTLTLPSASNGDVIIVDYDVALTTGKTQTFTTGVGGSAYSDLSRIYRPEGGASVFELIKSDGSKKNLGIVGLSNAGPGVGSRIIFEYYNDKWIVEARLTSSGTGIGAVNTSTFT